MRIIRYTTAPVDYDGFGSRTLRIMGIDNRRRRPVREVSIAREHLDWQESRYASGMHAAIAEPIACMVAIGDWTLFDEPFRVGDEGFACTVCGEPLKTEYGGLHSCGSPECELRLQAGADHHDECGDR